MEVTLEWYDGDEWLYHSTHDSDTAAWRALSMIRSDTHNYRTVDGDGEVITSNHNKNA